jgi:dTDP-3-amino-3,6-dideoxy-alpha-D-glucopyranose N,N-dimethyltransferase
MARRPRTESERVRAYGELAPLYDLVHDAKPYGEEARTIRTIVQRTARRRCRTLLDVACGSGRHLQAFARWFDVAGIDASPAMLDLARRRLPQVPLRRGRMESFDLGREFDVVTLLFSTIGYARSRADLDRIVANLARHTTPGGVVVVEPWLTPERFRVGLVHHLVVEKDGTTVIRMNSSARRGRRSLFDFHHLVGARGSVRHFVEPHDLGLFDAREMRAAFRGAGLELRVYRRGLSSGRGLYVGRRPLVGTRRTDRPRIRGGRSLRRGSR